MKRIINECDVIDYYRTNSSLRATMERFGLSFNCAKRIVTNGGLPVERGQKVDVGEVVKHYLENRCRVTLTMRAFHLSKPRVRRMLKEAGVYRDRVSLSVEDEQTIVELWGNGETQVSIANKMALNRNCVSRFLRARGLTRKRHPNWKHYRNVHYVSGYKRIRIPPNHSLIEMADKTGFVMEHRLVMAEYLGRLLSPTETVHHKNGIRQDNRIENLQLRQGKHGRGVACRCADCGSTNIITEEI